MDRLELAKKTHDQLIENMGRALSPNALSIHLTRFDTLTAHPHKELYEADRIHFRVKKRSAFLREAATGEFDYTPARHKLSVELYPELQFQSLELPNELLRSLKGSILRLWVLVQDRGEGCHTVTTYYRGSPFWKVIDFEGNYVSNFKSDGELNSVLAEMQKREGFDIEAYARFQSRCWQACLKAAGLDSMEIIH